MHIREELVHQPQVPATLRFCLFPCSVPSGSFTPSLQREFYSEYHYYQGQDRGTFPPVGDISVSEKAVAFRDITRDIPPQERNYTERCKGRAESTLYRKERVDQEVNSAD